MKPTAALLSTLVLANLVNLVNLVNLASLAHGDEAQSRVGKRYAPERSTYRDETTGQQVIRLTAAPAEDVKIYQTHPSWTSDGKWIVFRSNRTGSSQLFAVDEENGDIVQLTDEPQVHAGQVCLSRKRLELLTVIGASVVKVRLQPLLETGDAVAPAAGHREVVGHIPAGAELSGTMSWGASEKELYLGLAHADRPEPRRWSVAALDLETGKPRTVIDLGFRVGHVQANPWRKGWIQYCHETGGDAPQRMWIVRADGTSNRPFYRETFDEWVTHEIWWDTTRSLFTVWPSNETMRRLPHGIVSVSLADSPHRSPEGAVTFHSRFPYWHVTAAPGSHQAVADTSDGQILRVDLETGERALLTGGHRPGRKGAHPHPTMHPDGERVLFNSNARGNADLYLLRLGDEPARRLRSRQYRRGTPRDAVRSQKELRSRLFELLELDDLAGRKLAMNPKNIRSERRPEYLLREIEIDSVPMSPNPLSPASAGRRIRVIVTTPTRDGPHPAVVCVHGHGGDRLVVHDRSSIYKGFASVLASSGMVTISANVGQHEVYEKGRTLMGERLWDLMRCIDYLETLPEVDASRIGCAGLSLGGEMAMWLGAMDERLVATVSSGFLTTMDQMEKNHCMCWKFDGLRQLVDFADIYSLTAPRALQCQNGRREGVTQFWVPLAHQAMRDVEKIYADLGKPENARLVVHEAGHEIDLASLRRFLEQHLAAPERN